MLRAAIICVLLVGMGWLAWGRFGSPRNGRGERGELRTAQVERRTIQRVVEAIGAIEPAFVVEVKSKASGEVTSTPFDAGDRVRKGELLVELAPVDEERSLRGQKAQIVVAEANLAKARTQLSHSETQLSIRRQETASELNQARSERALATTELTRQEALHKQNLASTRDLEAARKADQAAASKLELAEAGRRQLELNELDCTLRRQDVRLAEASLVREQINLEVAELRMKETKVLAPMDGVILARTVERGQIIASGMSNVSGGTALLTLADVSRVYLEADVDESDVGLVRVGLPATVATEAYPDRPMGGTVSWIAPQATTVQNVTMFRVRVELAPEAHALLRPGMNGTARIVCDSREGVLAVPVNALTRLDDKYGVRLPGRGEDRFVPVEVGMRDGRWAEVKGPLEPGTRILTAAAPGATGGDAQQGAQTMRRGMMMMRMGGGS